MSYDEKDVRWNALWSGLFAAVTVVSLAALTVLPMKTWVAAAGGAFTLLEAIGLKSHGDRLPPLTYITRRYVPQWLTATLIGAAVGTACWSWSVTARPVLFIPLFALWGWLTEHFAVTYA